MVAAFVLSVVGGDDHLVTHLAPARNEGRQHLVHDRAGMVHLLAVVEEPVPHAVQRAGVQHAIVQIEPVGEVGERAEEIHIRGRHLVDETVTGHAVKTTVVDGLAFGFIVFDVAHEIERVPVEELGPEAMRHGAGRAAATAYLAEDVLVRQAKDVAVAGAAMFGRGHAGVDRGIAAGRD